MKKYFFIALITTVSNISFAGNVTNKHEKESTKLISGKVIDKINGEEIAGAEVKIGDKIIYTDLNGNFTANIHTSKTEAVVQFVSYNDSKINIDPFSYNTIVVELVSK